MKILFIRFSSLGDTILTTGVLKALKYQNPQFQIDVLTYSEFKEVFLQEPYIRTIHCRARKQSLSSFIKDTKPLIKNYDLIVDLHRNTKSHILQWTSRAKFLAYKKSSLQRRLFVWFRKKSPALESHVVCRYAQPLVDSLGFKYDQLEDLRPSLKCEKKEYKNQIVLHPFSSKATKEWPYFSELAQRLIAKKIPTVLIGRGEFQDIPGAINLINRTNLANLIDIIAHSQLLITNDSGPMHIGTATKTPTLALFGSTTPEFGFYPYFQGVNIIENIEISCRPCHVHGKDQCPKGHFACMKSLSLERVYDKAIELFKNKSPH